MEYKKEQISQNIKAVLMLEYLGVRIEDVKEEKDCFGLSSKVIYFYSVPESSTIEVKDQNLNSRIKSANELKSLAKECLTDMMIDNFKSLCSEDDEMLDEFIEDVKKNISDYIKCFAKTRNGEVWNKELGEKRIKELNEEVQKASKFVEV